MAYSSYGSEVSLWMRELLGSPILFFFFLPVFTRTNNLSFFLFFISIFLAIYNTLYRDLSFHWVHIKEAIMRGRG